MERVLKIAGLMFLGVLMLAAACGGPADTPIPATPAQTAVPTRRPIVIPTPPPGWTPYSRSTYQIALPDTWQEVKLGEADLKNAIAAAQESNPPLAEQLRTLLDSGQHKAFMFYAIDNDNATSLRNVSVARVPLEGTDDLGAFAKSYADALPNVIRGARVLQTQAPVKVNGINAAAVVYQVPLVDSSGTLVTLRSVQYIFVLESGDAYIVTINGDAARADDLMKLAQQIGTSFVAVTP